MDRKNYCPSTMLRVRDKGTLHKHQSYSEKQYYMSELTSAVLCDFKLVGIAHRRRNTGTECKIKILRRGVKLLQGDAVT